MLDQEKIAPYLNGIQCPEFDQLVTADVREYRRLLDMCREHFAHIESCDVGAAMIGAMAQDRDRSITRTNGLPPSLQFNPQGAAWLVAGRLMSAYLAWQ